MSNTLLRGSGIALCAVLAGCATFPNGPSMMALPGTGASFDQFRSDDYACQGYAAQATGQQSPQQAASDSGVNNAVVGTAVGAAAGALLGAASGNAGAGAAIGAGGGLILGSAAGADGYAASGFTQQERYDNAYIQCMYAKGHQVPVSSAVAAAQQAQAPVTAPAGVPPSTGSAYPPPGTPPPPGY